MDEGTILLAFQLLLHDLLGNINTRLWAGSNHLRINSKADQL